MGEYYIIEDEIFVLYIEYDSVVVEEKIWFYIFNFRFRILLIKISDGNGVLIVFFLLEICFLLIV